MSNKNKNNIELTNKTEIGNNKNLAKRSPPKIFIP